jgi:chromosome segregation ATPase
LARLDVGALPEAVERDGVWTVPAEALTSIAEREGWPLDLTAQGQSSASAGAAEYRDRYLSDTTAAHAAVVLAKTQASAARAEAGDLAIKVRRLTNELDAEQAGGEQLAADLGAAEKELAIVERDRAVAQARADELRTQIDQERVERGLLSSRIGVLEADREAAIAAMGWWSKRRYKRLRAGSKPRPPQT